MFAIPVGKATGLDINLLIAVSGLLMTVTVFFGISALTVLSVIAVPAIACLGGYSVWLAVNGMGGLDALKAVVPAQPLDFNVALALVVGSFISARARSPLTLSGLVVMPNWRCWWRWWPFSSATR